MTKAFNAIAYTIFALVAIFSTLLYASIFDDGAKEYVVLGIKCIYTILDRWFWFFT
jgi:hypothetical protein